MSPEQLIHQPKLLTITSHCSRLVMGLYTLVSGAMRGTDGKFGGGVRGGVCGEAVDWEVSLNGKGCIPILGLSKSSGTGRLVASGRCGSWSKSNVEWLWGAGVFGKATGWDWAYWSGSKYGMKPAVGDAVDDGMASELLGRGTIVLSGRKAGETIIWDSIVSVDADRGG